MPASQCSMALPAILVLCTCLLPLAACASLCDSGQHLIRYVSSTNGTNSPECLNSMEPRRFPCRSLPYALLAQDVEGMQYPDYCNYSSGPDNLCVRLEDGVHRILGELQVTNVSNIVVEAVNSGEAYIRCGSFPNIEPNVYDDLVFFCSRNVTLSGVVVEQCGPVSSGVYVYVSDGVTIENTFFRNISGSSLQVRESDNIMLRNCVFEANFNDGTTNERFINKSTIDLDDLNVLSIPGGALTVFSNVTMNLVVENCSFSNNTANDNAIDERRPPLLQIDGHGGAVFIRLNGASESSILLKDSQFDSNYARIQGGAVYLSISSLTSNSNVTVEGCTFTNNTAETRAGGALAIVLFNETLNNMFVIRGSTFRGNSAVGGGAVAVVQYDFHTIEYPDTVMFENCLFELNTAEREGSAVGMFALLHNDLRPFPARFISCSFYNNNLRGMTTFAEVNEFQRDPGGALSSFRYPIKLSGVSDFIRNIGGGLSVINTEIGVEENAQVLFQENEAVFGGGMQMEERCRLFVSPGAKMNFIRNHAVLGGGIYAFSLPVVFSNYIRNRLCYIQYNDPQQEDVPAESWQNVSIVFVGNSANIGGAALYISDVRGCFWFDSSFDVDDRYTIFTPPPNASSPFTFSDNQLLNDSRAGVQMVNSQTFASDSLSIDVQFASGQNDSAQSGENVFFNVLCNDYFNNSRTCLMRVSEVNEQIQSTEIVLNDVVRSIPFTVPSFGSGNDPESTGEAIVTQLQLELELPLTEGEAAYVSLDVTSCHPGYKRGMGGLCECDTDNPDILRCESNGRYLFVRNGVYAYVSNASKELVVVNGAPPGFTLCDRVGRLPGCRFKFDDPDAQCSSGRSGFLCGSCHSDSWVSLDLLFCSDNCYTGIGLLFLWCFAVIVVSLLVLILDIGHPAELRAFVFYAEVIGFVFIPFTIIESNLSLIGLGYFLNLLSFSIPISACVSQTLPAHIVALFSYIPPLLILGTVIIYIICARYISAISSRSALHGLSLLGVFIYTYIADTSFLIASCRVTNEDFVFLYDGTQSCRAANFVPFLVLSLLIIVGFVFVAPFLLCLLTKKRWTAFDLYHFTDELSKDLHQSRHWYAGWDLGRRLLFLLAYYFGVYLEASLLAMVNFAVAFMVLLVHVYAKPYKNTRNNVIETAILLNLLLVATSYLKSPETVTATVFVIILTLLPYVYAVVYIAIAIGKKIREKCQKHKQKYSPSDAATANNENGNAMEMVAIANPTATEHIVEDMTLATVATPGESVLGTTTTTTNATTTLAAGKTTAAGHTATEQAGAAVDPFNLTEDQIKLSRGISFFTRVTGSLHRGGKK